MTGQRGSLVGRLQQSRLLYCEQANLTGLPHKPYLPTPMPLTFESQR
jgi:hypothetical protein